MGYNEDIQKMLKEAADRCLIGSRAKRSPRRRKDRHLVVVKLLERVEFIMANFALSDSHPGERAVSEGVEQALFNAKKMGWDQERDEG